VVSSPVGSQRAPGLCATPYFRVPFLIFAPPIIALIRDPCTTEVMASTNGLGHLSVFAKRGLSPISRLTVQQHICRLRLKFERSSRKRRELFSPS
jgi:hypothetical protein